MGQSSIINLKDYFVIKSTLSISKNFRNDNKSFLFSKGPLVDIEMQVPEIFTESEPEFLMACGFGNQSGLYLSRKSVIYDQDKRKHKIQLPFNSNKMWQISQVNYIVFALTDY